MELTATIACFGGEQRFYRHASSETKTDMNLGVFVPPKALDGTKVPVVLWLSGLTCTEKNFVEKAGAQRVAAELGLVIVAPDTSPRGTDFVGEHDAYDFGSGAGFYVDATQSPWSANYRMNSYVTRELPSLIATHLPVDPGKLAICGHSMGGHGALTLALREPETFRSVSAFAPICAPMRCPWGEKALGGYLGPDRSAWAAHDATALIESGHRVPDILVDQGTADQFLTEQLKPELLEQACRTADIPLTLNRRNGYDHSYYFIASFIADHLRWHAKRLG